MRPTLWSTLILLGVFAVTTTPAGAFNPQPEPPASDPLGLAFGQTARIQVVNVVDLLRPLVPPEPIHDGADLVCAARLSLFDADGESIIIVDSRVGPGQTVGAELSARELGIGPGERVTVRGVVEFTGETEERLRCQATTRSSLEVFDSRSGKTGLVLPVTTTVHPPDPF